MKNSKRCLSLSFIIMLIACGLLFLQCQDRNERPIEADPANIDTLDLLTRTISVDPANYRARIDRARMFYERNAYDAALKDVGAAIKSDSSRQEAFLLKSKIEMDYFRSLEAVKTLKAAQKKWPESVEINTQLAEFYLILKQYAEAERLSEEIISENPYSAKSYLILGMTAKEKKDTAVAMKYFNQAVQYDADFLDAWIEMAYIELHRNPENAKKYFRSALQISPENVGLLHAYASYWEKVDSLQKAKEQYKKILEISPEYKEAYYNHALLLMDQDSFQQAVDYWDHFLEMEENSARGYYYRGISQEMSDNKDRALKDYEKARELDPDLPSIDRAIESLKPGS